MSLFSRFRFLPMTIFVACLLLTVKVTDIWDTMGDLRPPVQIAGAEAQTETPGQNAADQQAAVPPTAEDSAAADAAADAAEAAAETRLLRDDPTLLTPEEIDLLQKLSDRRREIAAREQEIESRVALLTAAEARIDRKIGELKNLQSEIEDRIKKFDKQQEDKLGSLVKIYENMKPKEAARIFEDLELDTLLEVAQRMKERKLAAIMAKMNPEKAREITVELRDLRTLPREALDQGN